MIANRSVPTDTVLPHVMYQNLSDAIAWLSKVFGCSEHYRYGDPLSGAQVQLGKAWIMLKQAREGCAGPSQLGYGTQSLTIFVDDVDAHYKKAKAEGAKIVEEPHVTVYGERQYAATDLDGHHWLFSKHARDVSPQEWGAKIAQLPEIPNPIANLPRPRFCYVEIPAANVHESASFYEKVFRWNIRHRGTFRPCFDDAGTVSGAWVTGRDVARAPGLLPYIWVDDIDATVAQVALHGGSIITSPHPDEPGSTSWIATFRDPAGNAIGLYQEGKG
jgi:predicted enzyme related to lactoylglutathione lyase